MITLVAGQKGGSGKTTVATNLAVAAAQLGRDVLLVDLDFQASTTKFIELREHAKFRRKPVSRIHHAQKRGNVFADLEGFGERYSEVVVDVGGADSKEFRTALPAADLLLSPICPYGYDLHTAHLVADLVTATRDLGADIDARWLISRARPRSKDHLEARELFEDQFPELAVDPVVIWERQPMSLGAITGRGVLEQAKSRSQDDIRALTRSVYGEQVWQRSAAKAA